MQRPIATVGALIENNNEFLLVKSYKWKDKWSTPGGKIEYGESYHDAVKREVKEETNLDVYDVKMVENLESIKSKEFHEEKHFVMLNFISKTDSRDVKLNEEHQAYRWVRLEEALKLDLNTPTRKLIESLMDLISVNIDIECIIGIYDEEKKNKQKLQVSVNVYKDLSNLNDDVKNTLDYDHIKEITIKLSKNNYNLIETFAEDIAKEILKLNVSQVNVNIKKPNVNAGVEIVRW